MAHCRTTAIHADRPLHSPFTLHPFILRPLVRRQPEKRKPDMRYVFPPVPVVSLPVVGSNDRFPVDCVYCVGRNYAEHAKEMGFSGREPPFFFMKPADAIVAVNAGETGHWPYPGLTANLHHEIELVVAIG